VATGGMTMQRREWLRRAALLAMGTVAADQLEILDRLGWSRTMFPSAGVPSGLVDIAGPSLYSSFHGISGTIVARWGGINVVHWVVE